MDPSTTWSCTECTVFNSNDRTLCECCDAIRSWACHVCTRIVSYDTHSFRCPTCHTARLGHHWMCPTFCGWINPLSATICNGCRQTGRPGHHWRCLSASCTRINPLSAIVCTGCQETGQPGHHWTCPAPACARHNPLTAPTCTGCRQFRRDIYNCMRCNVAGRSHPCGNCQWCTCGLVMCARNRDIIHNDIMNLPHGLTDEYWRYVWNIATPRLVEANPDQSHIYLLSALTYSREDGRDPTLTMSNFLLLSLNQFEQSLGQLMDRAIDIAEEGRLLESDRHARVYQSVRARREEHISQYGFPEGWHQGMVDATENCPICREPLSTCVTCDRQSSECDCCTECSSTAEECDCIVVCELCDLPSCDATCPGVAFVTMVNPQPVSLSNEAPAHGSCRVSAVTHEHSSTARHGLHRQCFFGLVANTECQLRCPICRFSAEPDDQVQQSV